MTMIDDKAVKIAHDILKFMIASRVP